MIENEKQYKRLYPRRKTSMPCELMWQENQAVGRSMDVSLRGLTVILPKPVEQTSEEVVIRIPEGEGIVFRARPIHRRSMAKGTLVGFEIERIESGKQEWQRICYVPSW
jgi:PilZ domain-containing protein